MQIKKPKVSLDLKYIRKQFPGLRDDFIFFDNAGGSQIASQVINKVNDYYANSYVQLGASYSVSEKATKRVSDSQATGKLLLNANSRAEIILGASSTMLLRQLAQAMLKNLSPGDEIIVTNCDHEANIGAWRSLERFGIKIKEWKIRADDFILDLDDLAELMNEKTVLVAFTHASNVLGTINPVKEITSFVHERNAKVCVDGVAYAPHRLIDVQDLDVDYYVYSFYKTYGPHQAVLFGKRKHLLNLDKLNHYFISDKAIPYKLQPGGVNHELGYGVTGITDYLLTIASHQGIIDLDERASLEVLFNHLSQHEESLSKRLLDYLKTKEGVRIIGSESHDKSLRVPTISFIDGKRNSRLVTLETDKQNIGIRYGDFYARRLIRDLDLEVCEGVVRVSMVHYNTIEEVDRLISVLENVL